MTRFILLMFLSVVLMVVNDRYSYLAHVRSWLTVAATPVYWLADLPSQIFDAASETVISRGELLEENARLKANNLILEQEVQKLASLTMQNTRLKELLNSSNIVKEQVVIAEVVGLDPDPFSHIVMINKGSVDGVFLGQAIIDAHGVMGQVIGLSQVSSRVRLISSPSSRVPVQNNRTGYRAIVAGTGNPEQLELLHIPDTADFKKGDLLTSSGIGQVYPEGYPVGRIYRVIRKGSQTFASVYVHPLAEVNKSRFVLLVFRDKKHIANDKEGSSP